MSSVALARVYRRSFDSYPHVTLAVAGGALTALGDAVAQLSQMVRAVSHRICSDNAKHRSLDHIRR